MQITKNVDLPEEILKAQKLNKLVIFAGAGISMGSPSNLPSFERLAIKIAGGALEYKKNEPIDGFLGRLNQKGVQVHYLANKILSDPISKPTPLHYSILSIFNKAENIKIVTTNQDRHFTTVAKESYGDRAELYFSPALPLGRDFAGIVYLHGSVDKGYNKFVLTDSDFGRAYLTEGWATRFLNDVFTNYTVLFIGYSHNDPIMRYLARGLFLKSSRFVFSSSKQEESWQFLGITSIHYPLAKTENRYKYLVDAVARWSTISRADLFEHERMIKKIAESIPPVDKVSVSYIENALVDVERVRIFIKYARKVEWLDWLENRKLLNSFFEVNTQLDQIAELLVHWLVDNFIIEHSYKIIALVQRHGQKINQYIWQLIAHQFSNKNLDIPHDIRSKWITILLSIAPSDDFFNSLDLILRNCQYPIDSEIAILLFEYLTRPRIKLQIPYSSDRVNAEINYEGDAHDLDKSWAEFFKPNLAFFAERLVPIITNHLTQAHLLLITIGVTTETWDALSHNRSAIEFNIQDKYQKEIKSLIDAARDIIEWLVQNNHAKALILIEDWSKSNVVLLKRLAIYGISESPTLSSDNKILWLLNKEDWLYSLFMKHEVFQLLKKTYSLASNFVKRQLLERVIEGTRDTIMRERLDADTLKYEIFSRLHWLYESAPDCPLAKQYYEEFQEINSQFSPSEHPDFNSYISLGWRGVQSPVTFEELLDKNPSEEINWFLTYQGDSFRGPDRIGLMIEINKAITHNFEWGIKLASALCCEKVWDSDIWEHIFGGWTNCVLSEENWRDLLQFLTIRPDVYLKNSNSIAEILQNGIEKEQNGIPVSCLESADKLAEILFATCAEGLPTETHDSTIKWIEKSINHPGGKLVLFWISLLSKQTINSSNILPEKFKKIFASILTGDSYTDQMGRVILASQLLYLFSLDSEWTRANILHLWDLSKDTLIATQTWHGYISWGQWNEALLPEILPYLKKAFSKLNKQLAPVYENFCDFLASIAIYSSINPLKDGWIKIFLNKVESKIRDRFAFFIRNQLESLNNEESIKSVWNMWMCEYWSERITGVPVSLSNEEIHEMIYWVIPLEPVFEEVVEKICCITFLNFDDSHLFYKLNEGDYSEKYPLALTRLLSHLLMFTEGQFYYSEEVSAMIKKLAKTSVPKKELLEIIERLVRLGYTDALELKSVVLNNANRSL
jgi:hypothetical protein